MQTRLVLNLWLCCNLCFLNTEITYVYHYAWRELILAHRNQISRMVFGIDSIGLNDSGQKTVVMIVFIVWIEWSRCCSVL